MAYDAADQYVVLVDGCGASGVAPSSTWIFQRGVWTDLNITSPPARDYPALAYDASDGYVVLFGGGVGFSPSNDTWVFSHGRWNEIYPTTSPPARTVEALAYDPADGYVVMFGGSGSAPGTDLNDTWSFHSGNWTEIAPPRGVHPSGRHHDAMTYDAADGYIVLYGGWSNRASGWLNDTWKYSGGSWTRVKTPHFPPARATSAIAFDPQLNGTVIFGGDGWVTKSSVGIAGDAWIYRAGSWSLLAAAGAPSNRSQCSMVWDAVDRMDVLYGGVDATGYGGPGFYGDTWALGSGVFTDLQVSPSSVDLGGSVVLTTRAVATHGAPLAFNYTGLPTGCEASNASVLHCVPASIGRYDVSVTVTEPGGAGSTANASLWVGAGPEVESVVVFPGVITLSERINVTVVAVSGEPLSYTYTGLPSGCRSENASNLSCVPTTAGAFTVNVSVRDPLGGLASRNATGRVESKLTLTALEASPDQLDLGQTTRLGVTALGGTGVLTYGYAGLPPGCTGENRSSIQCRPGRTGEFAVRITVTDQTSYSVNVTTTLMVNSAPSIASFDLTPAQTDLGEPVGLTVNASGGTGDLMFSYSGLPPGCAGGNVSSLACTPQATGTYQLQVTVTDAVNVSAHSSATLRIVGVPTIGGFSAAPARVDLGQSVVLAAETSGGSAPLSYNYSGLPRGCTPVSTPSLACLPSVAGAYLVRLLVRDGAGRTASAVASLEVNPDPVVRSFVASPGTTIVGSAVALTVTVTGGTGPPTYEYSGLPTGCVSANRSVLTCTPTASGTYSVRVTAVDGARFAVTANTTLEVNSSAAPGGDVGPFVGSSAGWVTVGAIALAALVLLGWLVAKRRSPGAGRAPGVVSPEDPSPSDPGSTLPETPESSATEESIP